MNQDVLKKAFSELLKGGPGSGVKGHKTDVLNKIKESEWFKTRRMPDRILDLMEKLFSQKAAREGFECDSTNLGSVLRRNPYFQPLRRIQSKASNAFTEGWKVRQKIKDREG